MNLQEMVTHAHELFHRYSRIDQEDVSPRADEQRGLIEQEGYALLEELVEHLQSVMPGLKASPTEDDDKADVLQRNIDVCQEELRYATRKRQRTENPALRSYWEKKEARLKDELATLQEQLSSIEGDADPGTDLRTNVGEHGH